MRSGSTVMVLTAAFGIQCGTAFGQDGAPPEALPPPPCCCCTCPPPQIPAPLPPVVEEPEREQRTPRRDALGALTAGLLVIVAGETLSIVHYATSHTPVTPFELLPVVGPIIAVSSESFPAGGGWESALLVGSWLQVAGVLIAGVAGAHLYDDPEGQRVSVAPSVSPGRASLSLRVRF